jgi:hypothetical protein
MRDMEGGMAGVERAGGICKGEFTVVIDCSSGKM